MMRSMDRMNKRHADRRHLAAVPAPAPAPVLTPEVDAGRADAVRRVAGQLWWHAQAAPTVEDAAQLASNGMAPE